MFADINPLFDGHRFCEEGVTEPDSNNPNTWFFHRDTDGNGRDDDFDKMLMAQLDPNHNATAFQEALNQSTDAFTSSSSFPAQSTNSSSPYEFLLQLGDGQTLAIQQKIFIYLIRGFHPTRVGLDAMVSKIFSVFPNWPPADPWVAGAANSSVVAFNPSSAPPDQPTGAPPTPNFCQTVKDCPSCPQGQCPAWDATYQITTQDPG